MCWPGDGSTGQQPVVGQTQCDPLDDPEGRDNVFLCLKVAEPDLQPVLSHRGQHALNHMLMLSLTLGASSRSDQRTQLWGCYGLKGGSPQKPYVEALTSNMMFLGSGGFGRPLGSD